MLEIPQYPSIDNCFYITSTGMYECVPISYITGGYVYFRERWRDSTYFKVETRLTVRVTFNILNNTSETQCIKILALNGDSWISGEEMFFTNIFNAITYLKNQELYNYKDDSIFKDVLKQYAKKYPEILL